MYGLYCIMYSLVNRSSGFSDDNGTISAAIPKAIFAYEMCYGRGAEMYYFLFCFLLVRYYNRSKYSFLTVANRCSHRSTRIHNIEVIVN